MKHYLRCRRWYVFAGLVGISTIMLAGCPIDLTGKQGPAGPAGPAGEVGPEGPAGQDAGGALPGMMVTITDASGASPVESGGEFSVTFTLETDAGETIDIDNLDRFSIYVSGPADNYQRVIVPEDERETSITRNSDDSYTYTFAGGFPATYAAPVNDSSAFGTAAGELTGQDIVAGTYTVGLEARQTFTVDGEDIRDAGDATYDFAVDGATVSPRELVLEANCEKCHNELTLHGSNRFSVTGCVLCHTNGSEDRISSDVAKATPGVTIQFAEMIHKIHRGKDLPTIAATANGTQPYNYEVVGFGETVHGYSHVGFPIMPSGMMDCDACHGGAAQADQIYTDASITQANCSTCHNDIDFTTGTILDSSNPAVDDGTLTKAQLNSATYRAFPGHDDTGAGGIQHTFTDGSCIFCHTSGLNLSVKKAHQHATSLEQEGIGLAIEIVDVNGMTGGGGSFFVAGDFPEVTFRLTDQNGDPVRLVDGDSTMVDRVAFVICGPTDLYQHIIPSDDNSRVRPWYGGEYNVDDPAHWVDNFATDGTYTYIFEPEGASSRSTVWPENYPPALDSMPDQFFPFEEGWGQLYTAAGTPLDNGTYTVFAWARRITESGVREPAVVDTHDVRYGSTGSLVPYSGTVTNEKCNACHGNLAFHGSGRAGVLSCISCHTPGVGTENVDMRIMIHKIHSDVEYEVGGDDFTMMLLPSMPGGTKHCTVCHANDDWKAVPERDNMATWKVACTSCHDSEATAVHAQLNTLDDNLGEACEVCHGDGAIFSVETSHAVP